MSDRFKTILIVKHGALGDVIRTQYILPGLLRRYPKANVIWFTHITSVDLLKHNPYLAEIVTDQKRLASFDFDFCISLDDEVAILESIKSVKCKKFFGAYIENGIRKYSQDASLWFDMGLISKLGKEKADELKKKNVLEHNEIFARMLGIEIAAPCFYGSPALQERRGHSADLAYFNIGLNAGAGGRWLSKQLDNIQAISLIKELLKLEVQGKPTRIHLLGGPLESEKIRILSAPFEGDIRVVDGGRENSLLEFAALIRSLDYLISSDSLALHLGISQSVRNLSFYAPTSAVEIGTFGTGVKVTSTAPDYCSYRKDVDISSITAGRLLKAFKMHVGIDG